MKRKSVFLITWTVAHPFVFLLGAGALGCLTRQLSSDAGAALMRWYIQVMLPLFSLAYALFRRGIELPVLLIVLLFLASGYLWGLSLWHARAAYRRLHNLPPLEWRS